MLREALAAIRRAAPAIAKPILDEAVDAERLTPAQEQRILERLRISPPGLRRPAPEPRCSPPDRPALDPRRRARDRRGVS